MDSNHFLGYAAEILHTYVMQDLFPVRAGFGPENIHFALDVKLVTSATTVRGVIIRACVNVSYEAEKM